VAGRPAAEHSPARCTTEELRREFLIQNLYAPEGVHAVYSHIDRMVSLGVKDCIYISRGGAERHLRQ